MKEPKTLCLVVGGETARFFEHSRWARSLVPAENHTIHAAPVNEPADVQGVTHSITGPGVNKLEPRNGPDKQQVALAGDILDRLEAELAQGAFQNLILIASPSMLGILRERMSTALKARLLMEIDKNLSQMPATKIETLLNAHLFT